MVYDFSADKNRWLIENRGISFEDIIAAIDAGAIVDILPHPNNAKYPNQEIYLITIENYIYAVPFVKVASNHIFLKTIFPHRKLTKRYLRGDINEKT